MPCVLGHHPAWTTHVGGRLEGNLSGVPINRSGGSPRILQRWGEKKRAEHPTPQHTRPAIHREPPLCVEFPAAVGVLDGVMMFIPHVDIPLTADGALVTLEHQIYKNIPFNGGLLRPMCNLGKKRTSITKVSKHFTSKKAMFSSGNS